jgi:hypothetical protein
VRLGRALAFGALVACTRGTHDPAPLGPAAPDPLASLRAFEEDKRHASDWASQALADRAFGADPYAIVALPDGRFAGILRGRDALVVLGADLKEVARVPAPRAPSAIAFDDGRLYVTSEVEPVIARYRVDSLVRSDLPVNAKGVRAISVSHGVIHVVEEHDDRLIEIAGEERHEWTDQRGPMRIARTKDALFVSSVLDHSITAYPLNAHGRVQGKSTKTTIDGPFWAIAASNDVVIASGVEDHPLDRRGGFFGYVDSFVYGFRYRNGQFEKTFSVNVSEMGLIVPKAISISGDDAWITSYGGERAVTLDIHSGALKSESAFPPGASAVAGTVVANPLLDAWITKDRIVRVEENTRPDRERLGEALFFTGLMAPTSTSDGAKSRFSCETCHFEGYVDGRIHHTGRGDVHATTKPLVGLFNNRPHFSRALDPDLSAVAENEFRVAGAPSAADPHFTLDPKSVPWLGLAGGPVDPTELRRALMSFLMAFSHRTNPSAAVPRQLTADERAGATLFRDRCERCHEARLATDEPTTRMPFERWESLIFAGGPIVWGSDAYAKTGVEPYVHENGARVPSLRRLYKKRPYFTNGSAADLGAALGAARWTDTTFSHAGGDGSRLDDAAIGQLKAFLDLL